MNYQWLIWDQGIQMVIMFKRNYFLNSLSSFKIFPTIFLEKYIHWGNRLDFILKQYSSPFRELIRLESKNDINYWISVNFLSLGKI